MHFLIFYFKIYKKIIKAFSSVGRAAALQAAGHRFESGRAYFIYIFFPKKNYKLFFLFNNRDIIKKDSYFRFYEIIFIYKMNRVLFLMYFHFCSVPVIFSKTFTLFLEKITGKNKNRNKTKMKLKNA